MASSYSWPVRQSVPFSTISCHPASSVALLVGFLDLSSLRKREFKFKFKGMLSVNSSTKATPATVDLISCPVLHDFYNPYHGQAEGTLKTYTIKNIHKRNPRITADRRKCMEACPLGFSALFQMNCVDTVYASLQKDQTPSLRNSAK